jgi:predicted Zn-dependent protease
MLVASERTGGLMGRSEIERLLSHVLFLSGADETEAVLQASIEFSTRFAHNGIHQNVAETNMTLEVRAVFGSSVGMATTNDLSPSGLERVVSQACTIARRLPGNPEWPGLSEPQRLPDVLAYDEAVAQMTPEARARMVGDICHAARSERLLASGALATHQIEYAVMNSNSVFAYAPSTQAELHFVIEQPEESASAYAHAIGWKLAQIDTESLRRTAIQRALAAKRPRSLKADEYPVVLEPYAVVNLLEALSSAGMGALAVQEGRSWMNGRLGQQCLSSLISIADDAFDPEGFMQAFDCEGVPKQRVPIIASGVPTSPVYDRLTAAREAGRASTGHAQPHDEDWDGPLPENLSVAPGETNLEEMIASIDRGLCVTRFWYVNLTTPHDCGVTGMTRDGVWWIERGELAYPVTNLRFDQGLVEAFKRVRGVGRELRTLPGYFGGYHRVPALTLDSFRFIEVGN